MLKRNVKKCQGNCWGKTSESLKENAEAKRDIKCQGKCEKQSKKIPLKIFKLK